MYSHKKFEVMQKILIDENISLMIFLDGEDDYLKGRLINDFIINLDQRWLDVFHIDINNFSVEETLFLKKLWSYVPPKGKMSIMDCSWDVLARNILPEMSGNIEDKLEQIEQYLKSERILCIKVMLETNPASIVHNKYDISIDISSHNTEKIYEEFEDEIIRFVKDGICELSHEDDSKGNIGYFENKKSINLDEIDSSLRLTEEEYKVSINELENKVSHIPQKLRTKNKGLFLLFEGMDGAGKGTCIREIGKALDPRFYKVYPRAIIKDYAKGYPDLYYLWKIAPDFGKVSIMDRTWYNWVLDKRVHNECSIEKSISMMYNIKTMEKQMAEEGIIILKFWVCITKDEQLLRFEERKHDPAVNQNSVQEDWQNREHWNDYNNYAEIMIAETTKEYSPWIIVEANSLKYAQTKIMEKIVEACDNLRD